MNDIADRLAMGIRRLQTLSASLDVSALQRCSSHAGSPGVARLEFMRLIEIGAKRSPRRVPSPDESRRGEPGWSGHDVCTCDSSMSRRRCLVTNADIASASEEEKDEADDERVTPRFPRIVVLRPRELPAFSGVGTAVRRARRRARVERGALVARLESWSERDSDRPIELPADGGWKSREPPAVVSG